MATIAGRVRGARAGLLIQFIHPLKARLFLEESAAVPAGLLHGIHRLCRRRWNTQAPSVEVRFGKPTFMQKLFYEKMYEKKPFEDATLYYYDNGVYKIISPGEEHYGVYVCAASTRTRNTR